MSGIIRGRVKTQAGSPQGRRFSLEKNQPPSLSIATIDCVELAEGDRMEIPTSLATAQEIFAPASHSTAQL
jgi:hypothetical protein